jgi:1,2-phenylacetyl-CoA epoxidase PaaB subunit
MYETKNNENVYNKKKKKTKFNKVTPLHVPDEINFLKEEKDDYKERHIRLDNKVKPRVIETTDVSTESPEYIQNEKKTDPFFSELSKTLEKINVN